MRISWTLMSNIRVTYSGLIGFVVGIISVITGIVFTLIVTRRLLPEEFGIWSIIGSMIGYFLIVEPIISYWSTRQIARGEPVGRTSLFSSTVFSIGTVPIYLILANFVSSVSPEHLDTMILASILIPVAFISQTLMGINLGHKPQATSYGLLGFEFLKIPSGLALVYFLDLGVNGAILATLVAYLGKLVIQLYFSKVKLQVKFDISIVRRWIKLSWIPIYNSLAQMIWSLDVIIFTLITASTIGVAYYAASMAIASILAHAGKISQALYPKLLTGGSHDYVSENFTRVMYIVIPLLGITIIFSRPALFALNPVYETASIIVILLAFRTFFYVVTSVFYQVLLGIEKIDTKQNFNYSDFVRSKLFLVPTLNYIHHGLYIGILVAVLLFLNSDEISELELVTAWSIISVSLSIPFVIFAWTLVRKNVKFSIPYTEIAKYVLATISFVIVFLLTSESIISFEISIFDFLPGLILELFICIAVYLAITYLIDKKTRVLFKAILMEIVSNK